MVLSLPASAQYSLQVEPVMVALSCGSACLQAAYKQELKEAYGIIFNNLFCLNNMPIKRYVDYLQRRGRLEEYMQVIRGPYIVAAERPSAAMLHILGLHAGLCGRHC